MQKMRENAGGKREREHALEKRERKGKGKRKDIREGVLADM